MAPHTNICFCFRARDHIWTAARAIFGHTPTPDRADKTISNAWGWKCEPHNINATVVPTLPGTQFVICGPLEIEQTTGLILICFQEIYTSIKAQHPTEGRRKWRLRVTEQFWKLNSASKALSTAPRIVSKVRVPEKRKPEIYSDTYRVLTPCLGEMPILSPILIPGTSRH